MFTNTLTIEQIRNRLADRRLTVISERTGINRNTLSRIRSGKLQSPAYETWRQLEQYLSKEPSA
jgi:transcriptional regulator with XRE-family HTH domain